MCDDIAPYPIYFRLSFPESAPSGAKSPFLIYPEPAVPNFFEMEVQYSRSYGLRAVLTSSTANYPHRVSLSREYILQRDILPAKSEVFQSFFHRYNPDS